MWVWAGTLRAPLQTAGLASRAMGGCQRVLSCILSALSQVGKEVPGKTCRRHQGGHSLRKAHLHNRNILAVFVLVTPKWSLWRPPATALQSRRLPAPVACPNGGLRPTQRSWKNPSGLSLVVGEREAHSPPHCFCREGWRRTFKRLPPLFPQALLETALTRVVLPMPILVLPPIIMSLLEKYVGRRWPWGGGSPYGAGGAGRGVKACQAGGEDGMLWGVIFHIMSAQGPARLLKEGRFSWLLPICSTLSRVSQ